MSLETTRVIPLQEEGATLEVEFDAIFLVAIAEHFKLDSTSDVSNEHIKMFIHGATKNALDKADSEILAKVG